MGLGQVLKGRHYQLNCTKKYKKKDGYLKFHFYLRRTLER